MRAVNRICEFGSALGRHEQAADPIQPLSSARALVAVAPVAPSAGATRSSGRADVPFLAQLIATRQGLAQTRSRRRTGVGEALGAYRTTARSGLNATRRNWGRSI
jgi:hypothetical protein